MVSHTAGLPTFARHSSQCSQLAEEIEFVGSVVNDALLLQYLGPLMQTAQRASRHSGLRIEHP